MTVFVSEHAITLKPVSRVVYNGRVALAWGKKDEIEGVTCH